MVLTCADDGELAEHLDWSNWTSTGATATGIVTWRACSPDCANSKAWDQASADVTLGDPTREAGKGVLFTRLELHVTGPTPRGFLRNLAFDEAPAPAAPLRPRPRGTEHARRRRNPRRPPGRSATPRSRGTGSSPGGPTGSQGGYTDPQIAAAITGAESSYLPGIIQPGVDFCGSLSDKAGWGLWQITCGNSAPAEYGYDFHLLDPWNNAEAAVWKCDADMQAGFNCFDPWTTYTTGTYTRFLQRTAADTRLTDPGEYVQINATPPGTPSSPPPDPGSTYGPPMPGNASAFVFWKGGDGNLWEAQGPADANLSGPFKRGYKTLGSAPAAGVDGHGNTYVYWEGQDRHLWEAYYGNGQWHGAYPRGMGELGSPPAVALYG